MTEQTQVPLGSFLYCLSVSNSHFSLFYELKVAVPRFGVCLKQVPEVGHPVCERILDMFGIDSVIPNVANKCYSSLLAKVEKLVNLIISSP